MDGFKSLKETLNSIKYTTQDQQDMESILTQLTKIKSDFTIQSTEHYKKLKRDVAELRSKVDKHNGKCDSLVQFQQVDTSTSEESALHNDYNIKLTELELRRLREEVRAQLEVVDLSFEIFNQTFELSIREISQIEGVKVERILSGITGVVQELSRLFKEIVPKSAKIEEEKLFI